MGRLLDSLTTGVGKKVLIAVTGIALILFLIVHLAGNLLVLFDATAFNEYSHSLVSNPLIYVAEAGLLLVFVLHFATALRNFLANRAARGEKRYTVRRWTDSPRSKKSLASTLMVASGLVILVFVPLHVWTFKFGPFYETADGSMRDLARLVYEIFANPWYTLWYVVALVLVGMHLWHGAWSAWQSLGVEHPRANRWLRIGAWLLSAILAAGFITIPVVIYLKL